LRKEGSAKLKNVNNMCDTIRFASGEDIGTVRTFQDRFKVDATKYGFDGEEAFLDCCLCGIDLNSFFKDNTDLGFYYENGDWWE
jgi:hypothetical protein